MQLETALPIDLAEEHFDSFREERGTLWSVVEPEMATGAVDFNIVLKKFMHELQGKKSRPQAKLEVLEMEYFLRASGLIKWNPLKKKRKNKKKQEDPPNKDEHDSGLGFYEVNVAPLK